jgi:hypothetical protein
MIWYWNGLKLDFIEYTKFDNIMMNLNKKIWRIIYLAMLNIFIVAWTNAHIYIHEYVKCLDTASVLLV